MPATGADALAAVKFWPLWIKVQAMRASLLATAIATRRAGFVASSRLIHPASGLSYCVPHKSARPRRDRASDAGIDLLVLRFAQGAPCRRCRSVEARDRPALSSCCIAARTGAFGGRSSGELGSVVTPECECIGSGVAVGSCGGGGVWGGKWWRSGHGGEESLSMSRRFEPP